MFVKASDGKHYSATALTHVEVAAFAGGVYNVTAYVVGLGQTVLKSFSAEEDAQAALDRVLDALGSVEL